MIVSQEASLAEGIQIKLCKNTVPDGVLLALENGVPHDVG
jgi:hypothetical protein